MKQNDRDRESRHASRTSQKTFTHSNYAPRPPSPPPPALLRAPREKDTEEVKAREEKDIEENARKGLTSHGQQ